MRLALLTLTAAVSLTVLALPAPWYIWQSKTDRTTVCAQTSPGDGWLQSRGPFRDSLCKQLGKPG